MSDPITQKLDEMQARCDAATPGPWRGHSFGLAGEDEPSSIVIHTGEFVWGDAYEGCFLFSTPGADSQEWDDAEFIAAARTDMPRLIAALRAVSAEHGKSGHWCSTCEEYGQAIPYPCPTVKAIAEVLGVDDA